MPSTTLDPTTSTVKKHYPNWRVIVLNDDHNTFEHVIKCFVTILPQMTPSKAEALAMEIHTAGAATVWSGAQEQAELYHMQLGGQGITMAPLEQEGG
jgi:ATP-dependent Clp protease adaptor protein ClpS